MKHGGGTPRTAEAVSAVPHAACVGGLHPPYEGSAVRATLAVRYLGVDVEDALNLAEHTEV